MQVWLACFGAVHKQRFWLQMHGIMQLREAGVWGCRDQAPGRHGSAFHKRLLRLCLSIHLVPLALCIFMTVAALLCGRVLRCAHHIQNADIMATSLCWCCSPPLQGVSLALSLHAPSQELRVQIVPSARAYKLDRLMEVRRPPG